MQQQGTTCDTVVQCTLAYRLHYMAQVHMLVGHQQAAESLLLVVLPTDRLLHKWFVNAHTIKFNIVLLEGGGGRHKKMAGSAAKKFLSGPLNRC